MNGRKVELRHNAPEQVREYLRAALDLVEELNPPSDLRVAFFTKAVDLTAAKSLQIEQVDAGLAALLARPGL